MNNVKKLTYLYNTGCQDENVQSANQNKSVE